MAEIVLRVIEIAGLSREIHEVGIVKTGLNVVNDENTNQCVTWLVLPELKPEGV